MGVVWRAADDTLRRDVAIKVLPAAFASHAPRLARFEREARTLASLNHPNVAAVYSLHETDGVRFLAMEYVSGDDLAVRLAGGPLPLPAVVKIGRQIVEALAEAHQTGIVHRDLKAANVKITPDGRVKVLDFGLAKAVVADRPDDVTGGIEVTQTGIILGTPAYMPPEQARGLAVDTRADVWAFGVLLYEMLTGKRPFAGATLTDVIVSVIRTEPDWTALPAGTPPALEHLVRRCLVKDVRERLQDIREARVVLEQLAGVSTTDAAWAATTVLPPDGAARRRVPAWLGLVALVGALGVAGALWFPRSETPATTAIAGAPSIAVIPFVDLSPAQNEDYFADGLTEELLNALVRNPRLRVAGRTSSFRFKRTDEDPRTIGRLLSVSTVLEGTVRHEGTRVRVSARLVSTSDGFQIWASKYDRELTDIIALQEEIAGAVAGALDAALLGDVQDASPPRGTNPAAYTAYLQGNYLLQLNTRESVEQALRHLDQAVALDQGSAAAWAGLSRAHTLSATEGYVAPVIAHEPARRAAERALAIDPTLADAHVALSTIRRVFDWDWAGSDLAARRALELAPNSGDAILNAARIASSLGRLDEALDLTRRAAAVDPLNVALFYRQGRYAYFLGKLDEATAAFNRALELNPGYRGVHASLALVALARDQPQAALAALEAEPVRYWQLQSLAMVRHRQGRRAESDAALAELIADYADISAFQIAEVYSVRGENDRAFEWLERAFRQRDGGLSQVPSHPHLRQLESDARYPVFLQKLGLRR